MSPQTVLPGLNVSVVNAMFEDGHKRTLLQECGRFLMYHYLIACSTSGNAGKAAGACRMSSTGP